MELFILVIIGIVVVGIICAAVNKAAPSSQAFTPHRELSPEEQEQRDRYEEGKDQFLEGYAEEMDKLDLDDCEQLRCNLRCV